MPSLSPLLLAASALAALSPLGAADLDAPMRFGLQATAARPLQDLGTITRRTGMGAGAFAEVDQGPGWTLRTRIDFLAFKEDAARTRTLLDGLMPPRALKVSANQFSVGVDLRKTLFPLRVRGPFLLAGVSLSRVEFETVGPVPSGAGIGWSKEKSSVKFGLAAGAGYRFTDALAFTVRYASTNLGGLTMASVEGGLEFRFPAGWTE
ncbi:outer membrane beta-barrel protein [Mesoterricola silvestris]|uniref:Outer membrane protein beta-barrel domain-containing protein n=1 Tax=Mesoterricola silvestris TaxID=2927979 RepID=A0AA48K7S4_9BACT|nr:outer membrane beta-barrel protein [Mesoterricola silvestris]BDU72199.1 hypothetical protein METEAL_13730 [Mesoterricola silvestris]